MQNLGKEMVTSIGSAFDEPESGTIHIKDLLKSNGLDKDNRSVRNQLFTRTNLQGYRGLKTKYALKAKPVCTTTISQHSDQSRQKLMGTLSSDAIGEKRQVSFEGFDYSQVPLKDQEAVKQAEAKAILKSPSAKKEYQDEQAISQSPLNIGRRSDSQYKSSGNLQGRYSNRLVCNFMNKNININDELRKYRHKLEAKYPDPRKKLVEDSTDAKAAPAGKKDAKKDAVKKKDSGKQD